ncbi:M23 family metallopeptidase [Pseudoclavibacter terrae]|uniref:M23 family metallopeptidase n=1 Tax=Pseudoclavibacter terrae TaxID=1530195 RepID=A0A7J5AX85_9MICO|nr:M23 family metallopeptidase [Pseudoclavibacter terrae]KAB1636066.1 M23 family metallopeptidase [Pseudoclavibacter terrae]
MGKQQGAGGVIAIVAAPVAIIVLVLSLVLMLGTNANACNLEGDAATAVSVDPNSIPDVEIAGYQGEQLVNAANVILAGNDMGLSVRDQTIGVMTAMGESTLNNIDYGDWETSGVTNPDGSPTTSIGLFQQQDHWGSREERLNPYRAAQIFYSAMEISVPLPERDSVEPTLVANRTQVNLDPYYYAQFWDGAVQIVEELSGTTTGLSTGAGAQVCSTVAGTQGQVSSTGWAVPGEGPITDPYGMRTHPIYGDQRLHSGTDLAAGGCDGPIWAAQAGTVTFRGFDSGGNGTITLDHGEGITTKYLHSFESGLLVNVGDTVQAGQQIAMTGTSGQSTGCHLHFMVLINDETVDPEPFLAQVGITLG